VALNHQHSGSAVLQYSAGVTTVLDAGGGTGRFSIWLAKLGYQVTHLDISLPMLVKAREKAEEVGVSEQITFVHGKLTDLSTYSDGQFDLVLSLDAPVSYTYPKQIDVIKELIRVAACGIVLCVSSRLGSYLNQFNPAGKMPFLVDKCDPDSAVQWYMDEWKERDKWTVDFTRVDRLWNDGLFSVPDEVFEQMMSGDTPWPVTYLFRPEELADQLRSAGLQEVRLAGPGALARTLPGEILRKLLYTEEFLHLSLSVAINSILSRRYVAWEFTVWWHRVEKNQFDIKAINEDIL
jgi:SAM-dependent methyltransferase